MASTPEPSPTGGGGRIASADAVVARLGLSSSGAAREVLESLGVLGHPDLVDALAGAANPDWTLAALRRLAEAHPDDWAALRADPALLHRVAVVTGASEALGGLLASRPELLGTLADELPPWSAEIAAEHARAAIRVAEARGEDPAAALVGVQRRGLLRVAARDLLALADTPTTARELSDLADGILKAAFALVTGDAEGLAVLAMGKLGARELNYVSDVDVLFVHADDDARRGIEAAKALLALAATTTADGQLYELDPNLRPEGRNGPLSRSLDAYAAYYERWAATWEYQALLKARPIAGSELLGEAFLAAVRPFVWPAHLGADAVEQIQQMKRRVEGSRQVLREGARQLKLAPGGLRDIEFSVQLLQLVHGPHDPSLRSPSTLEALTALADGGYIDEGDANLITDHYVFLRTVEHRLQLRRLRRTHTIPADDEDRRRLARAVGFRDLRARSALEQFDRELRRVQAGVRRLHEQLFYRPLLARLAGYAPEERAVAEVGRFDAEAVRGRLRALAFANPAAAEAHLQALVQGTHRTSRQLAVLLPAMLEALASSPDPDGGLKALRDLATALRDNPRFLRVLREDAPAAQMLAGVLGASPLVGRWLTRQPEVLDLLSDPDDLAEPRTATQLRDTAAGLVRRGGGRTSADALRRFKRREALRTALRDLTARPGPIAVGAQLTGIGEACLEAAVASVVPPSVRFAVIGMGRFGAGELGYASDLDVLFVYEADGATGPEQPLQAASDVLQFLSAITPEGQAFHVDADLRPEGKQGPLARTLESYRAYYERWADHWELQALTQARPVAGDPELGAAFLEMVPPLITDPAVRAERLTAIRQMKARVEAERAGQQRIRRRVTRRGAPVPRSPRGPGHPAPSPPKELDPLARDLKLGPGGLSDVEWTVQLLLIAHGREHPDLLRPGTIPGIAACLDAGLLTAEEAAWLRGGWELQSAIRNAMYLAEMPDPDLLPVGHDDRERLARTLGFAPPGTQALAEDLDRARRRVRKVHERRFYAAR